jgi:hypothetical protein
MEHICFAQCKLRDISHKAEFIPSEARDLEMICIKKKPK